MKLETLVRLSLEEDLGNGDITTNACIDPQAKSSGWIEAREPLVVSGLLAAAEVFRQVGVAFEPLVSDGARVVSKQKIATISGSSRAILSGERLALNFLMKLCGIATNTAVSVDAAEGLLRVVDTRKTTPLLRSLEKAAVAHGGGGNHRFALYDGVMIKDNHIIAAGGIAQAVKACRDGVHHLVKIEVEVDTIEQLHIALDAGADVILLDNMNNDQLREAVEIIDGQAYIEASGNMTPARIAEIKGLGLDCVSVGGLIHQATWADLALEFAAD
jgi:nicotinate-nucleotide pyrophosphorylase (carboxylating)